MWQRTRDFVVQHKIALLVSFVIYLAAVVLLVALSQGPQTEPFLYQVD